MAKPVAPMSLRPGEASKALGIHRSTLYRLEKSGRIKMERPTNGITLINIEEINRFRNHVSAPTAADASVERPDIRPTERPKQ